MQGGMATPERVDTRQLETGWGTTTREDSPRSVSDGEQGSRNTMPSTRWARMRAEKKRSNTMEDGTEGPGQRMKQRRGRGHADKREAARRPLLAQLEELGTRRANESKLFRTDEAIGGQQAGGGQPARSVASWEIVMSGIRMPSGCEVISKTDEQANWKLYLAKARMEKANIWLDKAETKMREAEEYHRVQTAGMRAEVATLRQQNRLLGDECERLDREAMEQAASRMSWKNAQQIRKKIQNMPVGISYYYTSMTDMLSRESREKDELVERLKSLEMAAGRVMKRKAYGAYRHADIAVQTEVQGDVTSTQAPAMTGGDKLMEIDATAAAGVAHGGDTGQMERRDVAVQTNTKAVERKDAAVQTQGTMNVTAKTAAITRAKQRCEVVYTYVDQCARCEEVEEERDVLDTWGMDIVTMSEKSDRGCQYMIVLRDFASGAFRLLPTLKLNWIVLLW